MHCGKKPEDNWKICPDCLNGPNGKPCKNGGKVQTDYSEENEQLCSCVCQNGYSGNLCETPPPEGSVYTFQVQKGDPGQSMVIAGGFKLVNASAKTTDFLIAIDTASPEPKCIGKAFYQNLESMSSIYEILSWDHRFNEYAPHILQMKIFSLCELAKIFLANSGLGTFISRERCRCRT